jgi:hypothetical protein
MTMPTAYATKMTRFHPLAARIDIEAIPSAKRIIPSPQYAPTPVRLQALGYEG